MKYAVWCNQRQQYYGATHDINETEHFKSLKEIKDMLVSYHSTDCEEDSLRKMSAQQLAESFEWLIVKVTMEDQNADNNK
jgi:hypothetical protein